MRGKSRKKNVWVGRFCEFYYMFGVFRDGIYRLREEGNEKSEVVCWVDVGGDWSSWWGG